MSLRPYQARALKRASELFAGGALSVLIAMPTGGGKTWTAAVAMRNHLAGAADRRGFWAAHRYELVDQAISTLRNAGVDAGPIDSSARCVVAMAQTIAARGTAPRATFCVFDEARHYVADDWGEVRKAYADVRCLGLDATPERADGRGLSGAFQHLVVAAQIRELVDLGHLVPCRVLGAPEMLDSKHIAQDPEDAFLRHTPHGQAVLFAPNVPASKEFASRFLKRGLVAAHVDGQTPIDQRASILRGFEEERVRIVCNVNVLTEGWDCPRADVCILARGCSSHTPFLQMTGRVRRPHPSKTHATLLDLRGVTSVLGLPDDERVYSLEGRAIRLAAREDAVCRRCTKYPCECDSLSSTFTPPTVTGDELIDWYERYRQAKEELAPSRASLALASMLRKRDDAARAGRAWKPRAILMRFRAVFNRDPSEAELRMAERVNAMARGES